MPLFTRCALIPVLAALFACIPASAQHRAWHQATPAQLAAILPDRAPVEKEHIETEMRTATGITDGHGHFIAGVVLLTAGYSAEGKYSHYLVVQAPIEVGGVLLKPGDYAFGWVRADDGEALNVHFNVATTGALVGQAVAHLMTSQTRVESIHIWPPDRAILQIGRFSIPYQIRE